MAAVSGTCQLRPPAVRPLAKPAAVAAFAAVSWHGAAGRRPGRMVLVAAAPDKLSEKVAQSVKEAEEKCAEDPKSGECVAAWDEVEELSAAASHARDRQKENSDPLEKYCKDNPETDECRTYDN